MARLTTTPLVLVPGAKITDTDYFDRQGAALQALLEVSDNLSPDAVVGGMLRFAVGDGYAWYRVTQARPLTLQHVEFGDNWTVPDALIRGLRVSDVRQQLENVRAIQQLFGGKKAVRLTVQQRNSNGS